MMIATETTAQAWATLVDACEDAATLEDIAITWQNDYVNDTRWSWGELAIIQDAFYFAGKRLGLLEEFRENGVC